MTPTRNFYFYLETYDQADADFVERFKRAKINIETVNELIKFAKERWPDHYSPDFRKSTEGMAYGKESMRRLWSTYLHWLEAGG